MVLISLSAKFNQNHCAMSSSTESTSFGEHDLRMNKTVFFYAEHVSKQASAARFPNDRSCNDRAAPSVPDSVRQDELDRCRMVAAQASITASTQHGYEEATRISVRIERQLLQAIAYRGLLEYRSTSRDAEQSRRGRYREELFPPSRCTCHEQEEMVCADTLDPFATRRSGSRGSIPLWRCGFCCWCFCCGFWDTSAHR